MKISIKPVIETSTATPFSVRPKVSQWLQINKKYHMANDYKQRIDNQNVFFSFIISNKQSAVAYEERSLDFRVLELPDSHSSRSEWPLGGWLCTSGLFKHGCTIKRPHWTSCYVLPVQTEHYLRRILTLGKPSHFSLHSGHSVFFEEVHHKARQCRQKLCPQFKVVGLTRMS